MIDSKADRETAQKFRNCETFRAEFYENGPTVAEMVIAYADELDAVREALLECVDMIEDAHAGSGPAGLYVAFPSDRDDFCERIRALAPTPSETATEGDGPRDADECRATGGKSNPFLGAPKGEG